MERRNRPNCFIVGAPKCGTTFWVEVLQRHPCVFFCDPKEPAYFASDLPHSRGYHSLPEYEALFDGATQPIIGDASVRHLHSRDAAANIAEYNPAAKILIFIRPRAPFIRAYHSQLLLNLEEDEVDLRRAWRWSGDASARPVAAADVDLPLLDYKAAGAFTGQIQRYIEHFPASQIGVVRMEDWRDDVARMADAIQSFLGVPRHDIGPFHRVNEAQRPRSAWLHRLSGKPPSVLLGASAGLKRLLGYRGSFGLARWIRSVNLARGYANDVDDSLTREIELYFADDEARTEALLARHRIALRGD